VEYRAATNGLDDLPFDESHGMRIDEPWVLAHHDVICDVICDVT
jgi:hypothetical protein